MRINWRGRYHGGGATAKHWWSPRARKDAQLAARILEYHWAEVGAEIKRRTVGSLIYGNPEALPKDYYKDYYAR